MILSDTPMIAKVFAAITVAYALSPVDLVPDFIPVLGLLCDSDYNNMDFDNSVDHKGN